MEYYLVIRRDKLLVTHNELGEPQGHWVNEKKNKHKKLYTIRSRLYMNHEMTRRAWQTLAHRSFSFWNTWLLEFIQETVKPEPHRAAVWRLTETPWSTAQQSSQPTANITCHLGHSNPVEALDGHSPAIKTGGRRTSLLIPGKPQDCER